GGIVLTVPAHGYQSGNVVKVKGTGAVDTGWRITVIDADRFSLDGARTTKALRAGGTVERNDAWTQVAFRSGPEAPADCAANDWFLRTDVAAQDGLYWCTSQNTWTRVRPGNFVMASSIAAVQFGDGAARYRFTGLEITHIPVPDPPPADWSKRDHKQGNFGALVASDGSNDRLIFDRCDIHGLDYPARLGRGLYLNGSNVALIHSRVHKVNRWGEADAFNLEATAIDIAEGPGPGKIEDNYLEAIGITLFFPDYSRHHLPPADFVISKNYFAHPEKYLLGSPENRSGKNYPNRQILELKAGQRMVVEGNIFDGNWADVTQGAMVLLTPRVTTAVPAKKIGSINQGILQVIDKAATDPYTVGLLVSVQGTDSALDGIWEVEEVLSPTRFRLKNLPDGSASQGSVVAASSHMQISDIDIRNNLFRNGPNLLWINGHDAGQTSKTTQRIRFHNNLVLGMDIRAAAEGGKASPSGANQAGRSGVAVFAAQGMEDLIVSNNTIQNFKGKAPSFLLFDSTKLGAHAGLSVVNNIFTADRATAASISGTLPGAAALDRQWTAHPDPKWSFHGNVICCGMKERSPSGNMWTDDAEDLGIVNSVALGLQRRSDGQYANAGVNLEQLESAIGTRVELIARKDLGRQPETTKRRIAGR
ncbi:MAG TPA: hypothetical protein VEQ63_10810, partial [Bryobacteraceae bacterium]|nr:hypothetical protein [Bryobacteraceae bacterium]